MPPNPNVSTDNTLVTSSVSFTPLTSSLPSVFGRIIQPKARMSNAHRRDRCQRPKPIYNVCYNPYNPPNDNRVEGYSLYIFREPLYNNRLVLVN